MASVDRTKVRTEIRRTSNQSPIHISMGDSDLMPDAKSGRAHSVWRERLIVGAVSGTVVLCWLVLYDAFAAGNPWLTAQHVGAIFARPIVGPGRSPTLITSVVFFCVVHYAVWIADGSLVMGVVHRGEKDSNLVTLALILSILFYVPYVGLVAMLVGMGAGSATYARLIVGALIGGATVAAQAYRIHPGVVRYEFAHLDDDED
jgi:hypothetical protein